MREATLQASLLLAPKLESKNLNGTLLRFLKKLTVRHVPCLELWRPCDTDMWRLTVVRVSPPPRRTPRARFA